MGDRPYVRIDPAQRFGQPSVGGVSTDMLAGQVWAGLEVAEVADEYGLRREDVLVACWWAGRYGPKGLRRAFRVWAEEVDARLWRKDYAVPDPPSKDDEPEVPDAG
jgi:uncharacterized protein (DUF433 family)